MLNKTFKHRVIEFLATGTYLGKIPKAPGTFGTLWGIPLAYSLCLLGPMRYMLICIFLIGLASLIAQLHENYTESHDPKEIVIDEIIGYAIGFTWLPLTWQSFLACFLLFRFFDILKPFPINHIDQKIKGGLGTVLDDVAAGMFTNIILQILFTYTSVLGAQVAQ